MKNVILWVAIFLAAYAMLQCNECEVKLAKESQGVYHAIEKR